MENEEISMILYFLRRKLYQTAQSICETSLFRKQDPMLSFWKAASYFFMEKNNEAIRDLNLLLHFQELQLLVPIVLIQTYRQSASKYPEALHEMEARLTVADATQLSPKTLFMIMSL
ncbi:hypothetical protein HMI55_005179, partial [Coelomomyces lativittatus]